MNSKYAPIVALTALIIIVVAALGWFLLIKPKFASAADISAKSEEVDQNTAQVQLATKKLTEYEQNLAALAPLDESVALNLPSYSDVPTYRARITDAVATSKINLVAMQMDASYVVDGWIMPPQNRVSNSIAQLFATGPINTPGSEDQQSTSPEPSPSPGAGKATNGYTPAVTASNVAGPVVENLYGLPITITVTGTYSATVKFLENLTNPDDQIFLIYETKQTARPKSSSSIIGVPDAKDGDVTTEITGAFYLLNPDTQTVDDDVLVPATPGGKSPFAPSKGASGSGS